LGVRAKKGEGGNGQARRGKAQKIVKRGGGGKAIPLAEILAGEGMKKGVCNHLKRKKILTGKVGLGNRKLGREVRSNRTVK